MIPFLRLDAVEWSIIGKRLTASRDGALWQSYQWVAYIAAGSEVPPPQNELFAIASEDRGFLSTIDVGILTPCWKFVWQLREFLKKFLHRFFTTTGKMPSGLKLPFLSSWGSQFPDFSSAVTFDNIDLTCVSYLRHAFLCSCLVHRPYCFVRNRETTSFFKLASWRIFYIIYVPSVRFESISYT
jgi:hypothetical protein